MFKNYLKQIGLERLINRIGEYHLNDFVAEAFDAAFPKLSEEEVKNLYVYDVPKVSADGSCSIIEEKAEKPYNLAETFGLFSHPEFISGSQEMPKLFEPEPQSRRQVRHDSFWKQLADHPQTIRLWRLRQIVAKIFAQTKVDWFGIYRKVTSPEGNLVLAKEAYEGLFSRAEFPLTEEFAKKSNNSTVGLSGKAIVIQDVAAHTGAYYKCDGKVQSEFCVPILGLDNVVIGIIDAEAFPKKYYTDERLLQIAKVAFDLGQVNLGFEN